MVWQCAGDPLIVNLLLSRAQKRQYERHAMRNMLIVTSVLLLMVSITVSVLSAHYVNIREVEVAQLEATRQDRIEKEKNILEKNRNEDNLQQLSQSLLNYQEASAKFLDKLIQFAQDTVCFQEVRREKNIVTLSGYAQSVAELNLFINRWAFNSVISEIKIDRLRQVLNHPVLWFQLHRSEKNNL